MSEKYSTSHSHKLISLAPAMGHLRTINNHSGDAVIIELGNGKRTAYDILGRIGYHDLIHLNFSFYLSNYRLQQAIYN